MMPIKSADSLWAIMDIPSSYPFSTSAGPSGIAGWNAHKRALAASGLCLLPRACCVKGGGSAAGLALVARDVWATATCGMKISRLTATAINRDFIFTPVAVVVTRLGTRSSASDAYDSNEKPAEGGWPDPQKQKDGRYDPHVPRRECRNASPNQ